MTLILCVPERARKTETKREMWWLKCYNTHARVRDNFCGVGSFLPFMWVSDIKLSSSGLQCQAESPFSQTAGSPLICETVSHWGPWFTSLARLVSKVKRATMFASPAMDFKHMLPDLAFDIGAEIPTPTLAQYDG